jgi:hypothetical protein
MVRTVFDSKARIKLAKRFKRLISQSTNNKPQWFNVTPLSQKQQSSTKFSFDFDVRDIHREFPSLSSVINIVTNEFLGKCGLLRKRGDSWMMHLQSWDDFKTVFQLEMDLSMYMLLNRRYYLLRVGEGKQDVAEYWRHNFRKRRRNPTREAKRRALCVNELAANCSMLHSSQQECGCDCPMGRFCWNNSFRMRKWKKVDVFEAGEVIGRGLKSSERIQKDEFVIELQGSAVKREQATVEQGRGHHHYTMALNGDTIIDASKVKCNAKYINHSCNPNCCVQLWDVSGTTRAGIFTLQDIEVGQELTIDYRWQAVGKATTQCLCNSTNCRGTIELIAGSKNKRSKTK